MQNRRTLSERLLEFAASSIKLIDKLKRTAVGRHIANQLMHSASSSGANYEGKHVEQKVKLILYIRFKLS